MVSVSRCLDFDIGRCRRTFRWATNSDASTSLIIPHTNDGRYSPKGSTSGSVFVDVTSAPEGTGFDPDNRRINR
ncbi:hypothetical protein EVAR_5356_1 [Eumeta japonica]|uniref:Uncharacterized protein n=1 Tax=Eumeta variegata TaxID=151549 RepID=A0A4C1TMB6_EUMVA|nr:hypothetical protein EVAR_5356_1 [Eumeta japonica]